MEQAGLDASAAIAAIAAMVLAFFSCLNELHCGFLLHCGQIASVLQAASNQSAGSKALQPARDNEFECRSHQFGPLP